MAASEVRPPRRFGWVIFAGVLVGAAWVFPLFHVVRLAPARRVPEPGSPAPFDAKAVAAKVWQEEIPPAIAAAADARVVVAALRTDADAARKQFGQSAGVGAVYYFVRGRGRVIARERNQVRVAVDGAPGEEIAIRTGPIFGNIVRDGCGRLDLNSFPGLAEYNALSSALNALVEQRVEPTLREKAVVGATINFAGGAEAPDSAPDTGEPALTLVPVQVDLP